MTILAPRVRASACAALEPHQTETAAISVTNNRSLPRTPRGRRINAGHQASSALPVSARGRAIDTVSESDGRSQLLQQALRCGGRRHHLLERIDGFSE